MRFGAFAEGSDTQVTEYGQTGGTMAQTDADILRLDGNLMAITLPSSLPTRSTYALWPRNAAGSGVPVLVNKTKGNGISWLLADYPMQRLNTPLGQGKHPQKTATPAGLEPATCGLGNHRSIR